MDSHIIPLPDFFMNTMVSTWASAHCGVDCKVLD